MPLSSVFGQPKALETLKSALLHNTVHHAYLFAGPEGVGKELAALGLCQALNCTEKPTASVDACGVCATCQRISRRNHPDVQWVMPEAEWVARGWAGKSDFNHTPSRELKVEQIRSLQERLSYKPLEAAYKVVIVACAHLLNSQAQNAFLKTLEEPPSNTVMVLLASAPERLLPTIRSRCSRVSFGPLPKPFVIDTVKEKRKLSPLEAELVAELSGGSLSRALEWNVDELQARRQLIESFEKLTKTDARGWLQFAEEYGESRESAEQALRMLRVWLRDVAVVGLGQAPLVNRDLADLAQTSAKKRAREVIFRQLEWVDETYEAISQRNAAARLQLERMLIEVMR